MFVLRNIETGSAPQGLTEVEVKTLQRDSLPSWGLLQFEWNDPVGENGDPSSGILETNGIERRFG
jgi:hypothetical protein